MALGLIKYIVLQNVMLTPTSDLFVVEKILADLVLWTCAWAVQDWRKSDHKKKSPVNRKVKAYGTYYYLAGKSSY